MPEYDKWYKDVLNGKRKNFYPNRIRLLENPGVPLFLFHVHYRAILGEAIIVRSTVKREKHFYWFDEFLSYPYPVELELLETDPRLPKARRGRWICLYISLKTIEEIRYLSRLSEMTRKKLGREIARARAQLRKRPMGKPCWKSYMIRECEKLGKEYKVNEGILTETQKYFARCVQKKLMVGRSYDQIFYAALYLAFRMLKIPKLRNDIASISGISSRKIGKLYLHLAKELHLTVPLLNPEQLIKSRSVKLGISKQTIDMAVSVVENARKSGITVGKAPSSIAAAAIFVACEWENKKITRRQIAKLFNVSGVTIRKHCKKLEELIRT